MSTVLCTLCPLDGVDPRPEMTLDVLGMPQKAPRLLILHVQLDPGNSQGLWHLNPLRQNPLSGACTDVLYVLFCIFSVKLVFITNIKYTAETFYRQRYVRLCTIM